jgi:hypothetical protein
MGHGFGAATRKLGSPLGAVFAAAGDEHAAVLQGIHV